MQTHRRHFALSVDDLLQALLPDPSANPPSLDTPYSKYTHTNYAASGHDVHSITEIIRQRQAQLDDVTADLASVESIMKRVHAVHRQLLTRRDLISSSMTTHRGLLSSIRRLPSELLGEIFLRCLPPEPYVEPNTTRAPLVLLAVCTRWRTVALKSPRLWCSLALKPSHRMHQQGLYAYHHWLSRARGCPLALSLDIRRLPGNSLWRYEVIELLQPYMTRVVRLHASIDEAAALEMLLQDAPLLEHLTLDGDLHIALEKMHQSTIMTTADARSKPRRLTSFSLRTEVMLSVNVLTGSWLDPGWARLTQLRVTLGYEHTAAVQRSGESIDGSTLSGLLALCPQLEALTVSPLWFSRRDIPAQRMTHDRLHTLNVVVLSGTGPLLDSLTLPALRNLQLRDLDILPSGWRHEELRAFLTRSQCPLETLRMYGTQVSITKADRQAYTALIPTLKRLESCLAVLMHTSTGM